MAPSDRRQGVSLEAETLFNRAMAFWKDGADAEALELWYELANLEDTSSGRILVAHRWISILEASKGKMPLALHHAQLSLQGYESNPAGCEIWFKKERRPYIEDSIEELRERIRELQEDCDALDDDDPLDRSRSFDEHDATASDVHSRQADAHVAASNLTSAFDDGLQPQGPDYSHIGQSSSLATSPDSSTVNASDGAFGHSTA